MACGSYCCNCRKHICVLCVQGQGIEDSLHTKCNVVFMDGTHTATRVASRLQFFRVYQMAGCRDVITVFQGGVCLASPSDSTSAAGCDAMCRAAFHAKDYAVGCHSFLSGLAGFWVLVHSHALNSCIVS